MGWDIETIANCAVVRMNTNKVNVQNLAFFKDFHDAFDRLETEFRQLPVVLTGQGKVFTAGLDFNESFEIFSSQNEVRIGEWYEAYRATNLRLFQYPRPTVAAINGHAIAGGLITALACDFRIAARRASTFGLNEIPIGVPMPAAFVEIIKYALGAQTAALMILTGKLYPLEQASKLGLFHEVVQESDLLSRALSFARSSSTDSNLAYSMSKEALQDDAIQRIEQRAAILDQQWPAGIS